MPEIVSETEQPAAVQTGRDEEYETDLFGESDGAIVVNMPNAVSVSSDIINLQGSDAEEDDMDEALETGAMDYHRHRLDLLETASDGAMCEPQDTLATGQPRLPYSV